jgi:hypothetical protein
MRKYCLLIALFLNTGMLFSQNLIAFYPFNGNAKDSSGKGYHGTINGTLTSVKDRYGNANSAYSFDGSTGYIEITQTAFKLNNYTYSAWIYMDLDPVDNCVMSVGDTTANQSMYVYYDAPNTLFGIGLTAYNSDKSKITFVPFGKPAETRRWYHLTITRSNTKLIYYIDGSLWKSATITKLPGYGTDTKAYIGMKYGGMDFFNGVIDDVRIYDAAMTGTAVAALHNSEILPNAQIAYYPFTGNAGDSSGNGLNGTVLTASLTADRFGRPNHAYSFTGTSSRIDITYNNFRMNRYTYAAWVSVGANPGTSKSMSILSIGNSATDQAILLGNDATGIVGFGLAGFSTDLTSPVVAGVGTLPDLGTWYHVAIARDDNTIALYVDGKPISSASVAGKHPAYGSDQKAFIGMRSSLLQYFKGAIDDVHIYNYGCTAQDVKNLYNAELKLDTGGSGTGIATTSFMLEKIGIYPNPSFGAVTITPAGTNDLISLDIYNMQGQLIRNISEVKGETRIDGLVRGLYFFAFESEGAIVTKKVVVE